MVINKQLIIEPKVAKNHLAKFVKGSKASKSPIVPISAQSNLNLDALIFSIEETINYSSGKSA